ncbi:MAG: cell division protein FtsL [Acidobacteria bacterium]|nr:cell division protein FtsL [Acidobacteriota bacterium]
MTDWADRVDYRNYAIRPKMDTRNLLELLLVTLSIGFLAGVLILHSWVRTRIVSIGYEIQRLTAEEESLLKAEAGLSLEEETLKAMGRIEDIAQNQLGMQRLRASQLTIPSPRDTETDGTATLAMMRPLKSTAESRHPSSSF